MIQREQIEQQIQEADASFRQAEAHANYLRGWGDCARHLLSRFDAPAPTDPSGSDEPTGDKQ